MTTFQFANPEYGIPTLRELQGAWANIPDEEIRKYIAVEHQYLKFHREMILRRLESKQSDKDAPFPLSLSTRAGAVKVSILLGGSIVEAALRAIYETKSKTGTDGFNNVMKEWGKSGLTLPKCWGDIDDLRKARNNVHLYRAAAQDENWQAVIADEEKLLEKLDVILGELQAFTLP